MNRPRSRTGFFFTGSAIALGALLATSGFACSANKSNTLTTGAGASGGAGGSGGSGASTGEGGFGGLGGGIGSGGGGPVGGVPQTCADAIAQQSYIGCEYWPTMSSNTQLYSGFEFAVAAANPTDSPSTVTVTKGPQQIAQVEVQPGQLEIVKLPWVAQLKQGDLAGGADAASAFVAQGAYKVTSSVPITLYQFNPLDFELEPAPSGCPILGADPGCFSFTNDASLLLPTTALRTDYFVLSAPTLHLNTGNIFFDNWVNLSGMMTVTATQDATTVTVNSTAITKGGSGVTAISAGGQSVFEMNAGDVLMLVTANPPDGETPQPNKPCITTDNGVVACTTGQNYDFTGSRITSSKPISVLGGHDCTFMPYNVYACDHIEESMFPVETLGQDLIVTAPHAVAAIGSNPGQADSMYVRVLSAADANEITFDPPVASPVTLGTGQWIEIGPVNQDFRVLAKNKILVGQYMVGENFSGSSVGAGDPALSVAIPKEQYRVAYTFLAPATYTHNFVNIVAEPGSNITIDGASVPQSEFTPIGATGFSVARHKVEGGAHSMTGDKNFGIVVYGYGSYTSYMYPGGLNLETVIIEPE